VPLALAFPEVTKTTSTVFPRVLAKEQFQREVEKELTGKETELQAVQEPDFSFARVLPGTLPTSTRERIFTGCHRNTAFTRLSGIVTEVGWIGLSHTKIMVCRMIR